MSREWANRCCSWLSALESVGHQVEVLGRGPAGAKGPKAPVSLDDRARLPREHSRRFQTRMSIQVHESDGALVALLTKVLCPVLEPSPQLVALQQVSYLEEMRAVRSLRFGGRTLGVPGAARVVCSALSKPLCRSLSARSPPG